ncbi:hypothetical protein AVEN_188756-1 [Araneus ventricosus]|uniref:Uncharacterized protein n=1 Tax=Araneus ventricosus TaxID=182803 RepID=A0A4Y2WCL9_ARAVE|nr:hypothetical protein AVEN_188756-1 [Araneus ventricosus]
MPRFLRVARFLAPPPAHLLVPAAQQEERARVGRTSSVRKVRRCVLSVSAAAFLCSLNSCGVPAFLPSRFGHANRACQTRGCITKDSCGSEKKETTFCVNSYLFGTSSTRTAMPVELGL